MIIYKPTDIKGRLPYEEALKTCKGMQKKYHMGQLKLLMSEIMFLSKVSKGDELVVYAGAAPGYHIHKLAELFPTLRFELWDPREFGVKSRDNIKTNQAFFTNEVAEEYAARNEDILFISDIRSAEFGQVKRTKDLKEKHEIDLQVIGGDMQMQLEWVQAIRPKFAFLKYRLPYKPGKSAYLSGKLYLQTYSPLSTEIRLLTNDYDTMVEYDHLENDERMAYFNCNIRFNELEDHKWDDVMDKYGIKKSWDNYIAFYTLAYYLEKKNADTPDNKEVAKLFDDIIQFHRKKYGQKYDFLYED
jgi:Poly A polymerase regulatory subunit